MHLDPTDQQEILRETARSFMHDKFSKAAIKRMESGDLGYLPEIWKEMAELGWMGLPFPEEYGGVGMGFLELAVLLEEMGKVCPVSPFFSTVVLGGLPILQAGTDEQKRTYLPGITSGDELWTLALTESNARYDAQAIRCRAVPDKDGYRLNGTKLFVPNAHIAKFMLCVARIGEITDVVDGIGIYIVETDSPGVRVAVGRAINNDLLCEVTLDDVRVPAKHVLGPVNNGWQLVERLLEQAAVAKCCEMVGGARQVLDMTVSYAKERRQFDRPIGSFQAVQHHCANMAADVDASWLITFEAAWRISQELPCGTEAAMAKAWVSEACQRVVGLGHQVHGGIGLIDEHDLPRFTKNAKVGELAFGDARYHWARLASRLNYGTTSP